MKHRTGPVLRRIHGFVGCIASVCLIGSAMCVQSRETDLDTIDPAAGENALSLRAAVLNTPGFNRYQRYDADGMATLAMHMHPDPFACSELFPTLKRLEAFEQGSNSPDSWLWTIHLADAYVTCHVCPGTGIGSTPYDPETARDLYLALEDWDHAERATLALPCADR